MLVPLPNENSVGGLDPGFKRHSRLPVTLTTALRSSRLLAWIRMRNYGTVPLVGSSGTGQNARKGSFS